MTPRQIVIVAVRLTAIVWVLHTVSNLYSMFLLQNDPIGISLPRTAIALFAALQIGICLVLWCFPATVAGKLLPSSDSDSDATEASSSIAKWQTVGTICIGLWALVQAIPDGMYWLWIASATDELNGKRVDLPRQSEASVIATVAQLVIGLALVLGAKRISIILYKLRTGGVHKK